MKRGEVVEAYGALSDRWIAIRPPVGQLDWVAAQYAHLLPGGSMAEIIDTPTPAWIHGDSRDLGQLQWQIQLQPTQQVAVKGQHLQKLSDRKSRAWYKIDPPAGEFRWVAAQSLSENPPRTKLAKSDSEQKVAPKSNSLSGAEDSEVQQASVIVNVESEPVVLAPGETIVSHDDTLLWDAADNGMISEGTVIDDGSLLVDETTGEIISETSTCATCGGVGDCDVCEPDFGSPLHRLRPISRLLSCFGIAIVEAERGPEMECGGCGLVGCSTCNAGHPNLPYAATIVLYPVDWIIYLAPLVSSLKLISKTQYFLID